MPVVSNTSPLNYLLLINQITVLPSLFTQVHAPIAVLDELQAADAPATVRTWAQNPPPWLIIQSPATIHPGLPLHPGELHAISLALELKADRLIIDEHAGRSAAKTLGIPVVGTLGILDLAAEKGLLHLPHVLPQLVATNYRISQALIDELLNRDSARRPK